MSLMPRRSASMSIEIPDLEAKIKAWKVLAPKAFDVGLESGIRAATIEVSSKVKELLDGPVLNRRTHRLWRSIQPEVFRKSGTIVGIVGTDVEYAAIHEFGGVIRPKTADRFLVWRGASSRSAETGRFQKGDLIFARQVEIPKRPFMSRAFKENKGKIGQLIQDHVVRAVKGTLKTGRVSVPPSQRTGVGYHAD